MQRRAFLDRLIVREDIAAFPPIAPAGRDSERHSSLELTERVDLFVTRLRELGATPCLLASRGKAQEAIELLLEERALASVACAESLRWPGIDERWTLDARNAAFGLTEATWAVAETGTVIVFSSTSERRGYSLLPASIGVVVLADRLLSSLDEALHKLTVHNGPLPSCVSFVTGPSNTADIASVRVVGVHGPREVFVWIVDDGGPGGGSRHE